MSDDGKNDSPQEQEKLEDILVRAAIGGKSKNKRVVMSTNSYGEESRNTSIDEREIMPNAALVRLLIDQQIGGPKDWC